MKSISPSVTRTSHPFLSLGETIQEEVDCDIQIPKVDERRYQTKEGFASKENNHLTLGMMMEQGIACCVMDK
jgi:hypothetical protein